MIDLFNNNYIIICLKIQKSMVKLYSNIGTHDGKFHCDEALACYLLKCLPNFIEAKIIRTRNTELLNQCDVVVDVGGVYSFESMRFDHHQKTFDKTFNSIIADMTKFDVIKLSSAGLIYAHFGNEVIKEILNKCAAYLKRGYEEMSNNHVSSNLNINLKDLSHNPKFNKYVYEKMYENFVQEIDAIDNGVEMVETDKPKKYTISTNLSSRVSHLNPSWNDHVTSPDAQFDKAMELVGSEFVSRVLFYAQVMWPAIEIVQNAIDNRYQIDESGQIILLTAAPWQDTLFEIERTQNIQPTIKYVIFASRPSPSNLNSESKATASITCTDWRIQCVAVEKGSFVCRQPLPLAWRGLQTEELSKVSGIAGCTFVHINGFIGGNLTQQGALEMARKALTNVVETINPIS